MASRRLYPIQMQHKGAEIVDFSRNTATQKRQPARFVSHYRLEDERRSHAEKTSRGFARFLRQVVLTEAKERKRTLRHNLLLRLESENVSKHYASLRFPLHSKARFTRPLTPSVSLNAPASPTKSCAMHSKNRRRFVR